MKHISERLILLVLLGVFLSASGGADAAMITSMPFRGVTLIQRTETSPRPLKMNIVLIDLTDPDIRFRVTPPNGDLPEETTRQTTRQFLTEQNAQLAINAHFFNATLPVYTDNLSLAVADGVAYSPFSHNYPALNISPGNFARVIRRAAGDATGYAPDPDVNLHNAVAGNEQIITAGENTAVDNNLHPRTAIGIIPGRQLLLFTVDGRQPGVSEGMTTVEVASLLISDYGVNNALNLDGGGSTTMVIADPTPRLLNVPVGLGNIPGTERPNGTNLAIFAAVPEPSFMVALGLVPLLLRRSRR